MADKTIKQLLNKTLGTSRPTLTLYPVTTGNPAGGGAGARIISLAGAGWGAAVNLIAGGVGAGIDFWLTQLQYDFWDGGAIQVMSVRINNATLGTIVYETKVHPTIVSINIAPVTFPYPIYCNPATQITGQGAGAAIRGIYTSVLVATGI